MNNTLDNILDESILTEEDLIYAMDVQEEIVREYLAQHNHTLYPLMEEYNMH